MAGHTENMDNNLKIAVTYDQGEVFGHFGHTEQFKIYEVKEGKIVSDQILDTNGTGHEALADLLAHHDIDVLICGGIGGGAQAALEEAGVALCAGASGDADAAVEAFLRGELENTGANCDHHEHAENAGGCGGHCGGCHGCRPAFDGKNVGKTVKVHYTGTFNNGEKFDSSYDRQMPLEFVCGAGMMIEGFDRAVADMEVGSVRDVHLMPSEAYGEINPQAIFTVQIKQMPGSEELTQGQRVHLSNAYGQPIPVTVVEKTEETITFDANHEMAGKELNFRIELISVD